MAKDEFALNLFIGKLIWKVSCMLYPNHINNSTCYIGITIFTYIHIYIESQDIYIVASRLRWQKEIS